jgi:hypothetical protein
MTLPESSNSGIGNAQSLRHSLPARGNNITQKVRIADQRTFYISVQDDEYPTEIFIRQNIDPLIKSPDEDLSQITQQEQSSAKGEDS